MAWWQKVKCSAVGCYVITEAMLTSMTHDEAPLYEKALGKIPKGAMLYFFKPRQRITLFIRSIPFYYIHSKILSPFRQKSRHSCFPIPYHHPTCSLCRFPVFAVVWYNESRTENARIGKLTLSVRVFRIIKQNSAKLKQKKMYIILKHIITIVTWSGVLYHASWMSSYHRITLDASRLVWSYDISSSTRRDSSYYLSHL